MVMTGGRVWVAIALVALAGCAETTTPQGQVSDVPEGVLAIAAPFQDLSNLRIDPEDGCYQWLHNGPVETTYLPLRTDTGRPICTRAPSEV